MVAFKNFLGGLMYVDESRKEEYLANGYSLFAENESHTKSEEEVIEEVEVPEEPEAQEEPETPEEPAAEISEEKPKRRRKR